MAVEASRARSEPTHSLGEVDAAPSLQEGTQHIQSSGGPFSGGPRVTPYCLSVAAYF